MQHQALLVIISIWSFVSFIWIICLYGDKYTRKDEFKEFLKYHQKFVSLYIMAAMRNRKLIKTIQQYKHAVADSVFYPRALSLEDVQQWFKHYDIDQSLVDECESSLKETSFYFNQSKDVTKAAKQSLSSGF